MKRINFISLTTCLQLIFSFSATGRASAVNPPTVVTTSGKLIGVEDGAGGMFTTDTLEVQCLIHHWAIQLFRLKKLYV